MSRDAGERPVALRLDVRLGFLALGFVVLLEALFRSARDGTLQGLTLLIARPSWPLLLRYAELRAWSLERPALATIATLALAGLGVIFYRSAVLVWHNQIVARLSGIHFGSTDSAFPSRPFDLLRAVQRRPARTLFVGLEPFRWGPFWRTRPVYMTHQQKTMHRHVIGKTGSGKTVGVAFVGALQDLLDRKGLIFVSGKGSDEEIGTIKALAELARRPQQLRVLSLPAWNRPQIFSHTYNMVYVRPVEPGDAGGDPAATAERVFSALPLGDEAYYNTQAEILFTNLFKLLHGIVDENGRGLPFVVRDIAVCVNGIGTADAWSRALDYCLAASRDRDAARNIGAQIRSLGRDVGKCISGLRGALAKFDSPLINAYDPDIIFEEVLEQDLIVYAQLPANLFPIQAKTLGRVILRDIQQEGSLRQVFRTRRNQNPCAVYLDEFYTFAELGMIDSLNKLRDAHVEYTLLHQTIADLELVSREFATAVWDNCRGHEILAQDNPELCEKVAKSIGTQKDVEHTAQRAAGPWFTSISTGNVSTKFVEAYRLHPNRIKNLATFGQGFHYTGDRIRPVIYGMLPPTLHAEYPLTRKDQASARGLRLYERFVGAAAPAS